MEATFRIYKINTFNYYHILFGKNIYLHWIYLLLLVIKVKNILM